MPLSGDIVYTNQPFGFNANGLVIHEGHLIIGQTNTGKLFVVDPATGVTNEIDLGGASVFGADGFVVHGNVLYISQNFPQTVSIVALSKGDRAARVTRVVRDSRFDIPTSSSYFGGSLYVLNSRLTTPVTPDTTYTIARVTGL